MEFCERMVLDLIEGSGDRVAGIDFCAGEVVMRFFRRPLELDAFEFGEAFERLRGWALRVSQLYAPRLRYDSPMVATAESFVFSDDHKSLLHQFRWGHVSWHAEFCAAGIRVLADASTEMQWGTFVAFVRSLERAAAMAGDLGSRA